VPSQKKGALSLRPKYLVTRITLTPAAVVRRARRHAISRQLIARLPLAFALVGGAPQRAFTQPPDTARGGNYQPDAVSTGQFASRRSLQQLARGTAPSAAIASERLSNGDFQVGDRIALSVAGEQALTDTFTVREGQFLRLPSMTDIPLHGVLHSELQDSLAHALGRFIKDPNVRATPLVRVAVLGAVARPGFYSAAADELVSTMLMRAGGLSSNADLAKTLVRRGTETVYTSKVVETAMAQGETLDQLDVRPGDQLVVGEHPPGGAGLRILGIVALVSGIGVSIALIAR
jgi:protein involved in polysaccharide export with SLBB domain